MRTGNTGIQNCLIHLFRQKLTKDNIFFRYALLQDIKKQHPIVKFADAFMKTHKNTNK